MATAWGGVPLRFLQFSFRLKGEFRLQRCGYPIYKGIRRFSLPGFFFDTPHSSTCSEALGRKCMTGQTEAALSSFLSKKIYRSALCSGFPPPAPTSNKPPWNVTNLTVAELKRPIKPDKDAGLGDSWRVVYLEKANDGLYSWTRSQKWISSFISHLHWN